MVPRFIPSPPVPAVRLLSRKSILSYYEKLSMCILQQKLNIICRFCVKGAIHWDLIATYKDVTYNN